MITKCVEYYSLVKLNAMRINKAKTDGSQSLDRARYLAHTCDVLADLFVHELIGSMRERGLADTLSKH